MGSGNCIASGCHATNVIHTATPSAVADCTSCHTDKASGHFTGIGACRTCHADVVGYHHQSRKAIPLSQCTTCHDGTIASAKVSHDGIQQCTFCHSGMNRPTQAITCKQCHFRTAGLPADIVCTQCHSETGVFGREQVHSSTPTSDKVCADCHQPHYADIGICATCHAQADQVHHGITPLLRSSMTLAAGPATVTFRGGTILTGLLTNGAAPLPGETVTIQAEAAGAAAFAPLGAATTGPDGGFSLGVSPQVTTTYRAYWVGRGQSTEVLGPAVMTVVVGVRPVVTIKLAGAAGRSGQYARFPLGRSVGVSGAVQPNHAKLSGGSRPGSVTLTVDRQVGSGTRVKWVRAARSTRLLTAASTFSWPWKPKVRGVCRVVASFPGDADHLAAQSLTVLLKVY